MNMHALDWTSKTDQKNGMVCYVSTKTFRVIGGRNPKKVQKIADSAKYFEFAWEISQEIVVET